MKFEKLPENVKHMIHRIEKKYRKNTNLKDEDMVLIGLFLFQRYYDGEI